MNPRTLKFTFEVLKLFALRRQTRLSASPEIVCEDQIIFTHPIPLHVCPVSLELTFKIAPAVLKYLMFALAIV